MISQMYLKVLFNVYLFLGSGFIKKLDKNKIIWTNNGNYELSDDNSEEDKNNQILKNLKHEFDLVNEEDVSLGSMYGNLKKNLEIFTNESKYKEYSYATFEDIRGLTKDDDNNLIAIRAPNGTSIEIPEVESIQKLYNQTLEVF